MVSNLRGKQIILGTKGLTDLENYLDSMEKAINTTRKELVDDLCETGRALVAEYTPIEDGDLKSSTTKDVTHGVKQSSGRVFQTEPHAMYVEFGTGIVGQGQPHPYEHLFGWIYDSNKHGDDGWWYYDPDQNKYRFTRGQIASQQHLKASIDLRSVFAKQASDIYHRRLKK